MIVHVGGSGFLSALLELPIEAWKIKEDGSFEKHTSDFFYPDEFPIVFPISRK